MKVYILSEDIYFNLGLQAIFTKSGYDICTLCPTADALSFDSSSKQPCFLIIDIHDPQRLDFLTEIDMPENLKLVFVTNYFGIDSVESFADKLLSKRLPCSQIIPWLKKYGKQKYHRGHLLSAPERMILSLLSQGMSPNEISRRLSVSVKDISRHKVNVRHKLGMKKMNGKSLLYVNDYLCKMLLLTSIHGQTAQHTVI
jgi:DNA-binding CsgD family transcriptional regulator